MPGSEQKLMKSMDNFRKTSSNECETSFPGKDTALLAK